MNAASAPFGLLLTRGELVGESVRRELRHRHVGQTLGVPAPVFFQPVAMVGVAFILFTPRSGLARIKR